eukprot:6519587-Prymnesium_polylepis.1
MQSVTCCPRTTEPLPGEPLIGTADASSGVVCSVLSGLSRGFELSCGAGRAASEPRGAASSCVEAPTAERHAEPECSRKLSSDRAGGTRRCGRGELHTGARAEASRVSGGGGGDSDAETREASMVRAVLAAPSTSTPLAADVGAGAVWRPLLGVPSTLVLTTGAAAKSSWRDAECARGIPRGDMGGPAHGWSEPAAVGARDCAAEAAVASRERAAVVGSMEPG